QNLSHNPFGESYSSSSSQEPSLHKVSFCCPGPLHADIPFYNAADFPDEHHHHQPTITSATLPTKSSSSQPKECSSIWSLYDDIYHDTLYAYSKLETLGCIFRITLATMKNKEGGKGRKGNNFTEMKRWVYLDIKISEEDEK
ncbi:hypothetical protein RYX36_026076, partial [Vicia faba]